MSLIGLVAAALSGLVMMGTASAQIPNVTIGTNPAGTVFYAVGSGLAKVASESGKVRMSIQPYSGSSTFIPLLNTGELDFGMVNAVDMALAYRGPHAIDPLRR